LFFFSSFVCDFFSQKCQAKKFSHSLSPLSRSDRSDR
jgi:hypothetical protein